MTSQNLIVIKIQVIYQKTSSLSCQTQDILAKFSRSFILTRFDFSNITLNTVEESQH